MLVEMVDSLYSKVLQILVVPFCLHAINIRII